MCFSLQFLMMLLIWAVVLGAVFAIVKLLLPFVLGPLGAPGALIMQVLMIVLWAVVIIAVIWIVFELLSCLIGGVPRLR